MSVPLWQVHQFLVSPFSCTACHAQVYRKCATKGCGNLVMHEYQKPVCIECYLRQLIDPRSEAR